MSDFITLQCPQCGGVLSDTLDINRFACDYCGVEHLVRQPRYPVQFRHKYETAFVTVTVSPERTLKRLLNVRQKLRNKIDSKDEYFGECETMIMNTRKDAFYVFFFLGLLFVGAVIVFLFYSSAYLVPLLVVPFVFLISSVYQLFSKSRLGFYREEIESSEFEIDDLRNRLRSINTQICKLKRTSPTLARSVGGEL